MKAINAVAIGLVVVILAPALVVFAGFWFALALAIAALAVLFGGKAGIDILKSRQAGVSARKKEIRSRINEGEWER